MTGRRLKKRFWVPGLLLVLTGVFAFFWVSATDFLRPAYDGKPLVLAHRAGSGEWPQNSRTAVRASVAAYRAGGGFDGIEVDVVLTSDGVPVLAHDPRVHKTLCTTADGQPINGEVLIKDLTLAELQARYLCGGVTDPDFPDVRPVAETVATLAEVLAAVSEAPQMVVYLDVKLDPGLTASADAYAAAIHRVWHAAGARNPLMVEAPVHSFAGFRRFIERPETQTVLSYPPFSARDNAVRTVLWRRWQTRLRLVTPLEEARAANARAVASPTWVMTWPAARDLREAGVGLTLFTINTRAALDKYCRWPVDVLITDYPRLGGCGG